MVSPLRPDEALHRGRAPNSSLLGALLLPGYAKNMPSLQPHKDAVCEIHLKVSTQDRPALVCTPGALHVPGTLVYSLSSVGT